MTAAVAPPSSDEICVRFPPFPSPPPGVTIVPFKEYATKEIGIKLTCPNSDGIEVDGRDIPTVALGHPHATDKCKTDAFREEKGHEDFLKAKKRKNKASSSFVNGDIKPEWWQIWADEEADKFTGPYDHNTPAIDRLCRAATDFRLSRNWPQGEPRQLSAEKLFNHFAVFTGLRAIIPTWIRAERRKAEGAMEGFKDMVEKSGQNGTHDENDEGSDGVVSDDDDVSGPSAPVQVQEGQAVFDQKDQEEQRRSEAETVAIQEEHERKDDRLLAFLEDPETVVKMFFSSYMRKEGLVWADSNLSITPRVVFFFLRYILRNNLLPEYKDGLKKALEVVERAQVELPRTSTVAKDIPCDVSRALRGQYGSKENQFEFIMASDDEVGHLDNDEETYGEEQGDVNMDETNNDYDPALEETTVEYVGDGEFIDAEQPVEEEEDVAKIEEVGEEEEESDDQPLENGTGQTDNGWGDVVTGAEHGWGSGVWDVQGGWDAATKYQFENDPSWTADWTTPVYSLKNFLGIEALPDTYTTGVVEEGVRRIVSVHEPEAMKTHTKDGDGALEEEFESKLGRIVLAPWNDWDIPKEGNGFDEIRRVYSEIYQGRRVEKKIRSFHVKDGNGNGGEGEGEENKIEATEEEDTQVLNPEELYDEDGREYSESTNAKIVWESSKGWVVDPNSSDGNVVVYSNCTTEKPTEASSEEYKSLLKSLHVHNPTKDVIQVLVDPAVIEKLKDVVGLGFGGTFVQLVKNGKDEAANRFWYIDKLMLTIPSFYVS